jgi:hypothetical protein
VEAIRCPQCGAMTVVSGRFVQSPLGFVPSDTRFLLSQNGVALRCDTVRACVSCGHVWNNMSLDPAGLRAFIRSHGGELAWQHLESLEFGPYRGLPDTPEARAAADQAAEIDSLVREGKQADATRRLRALRHTTWDDAINTLRRWRDLKREDKLALFGWRDKHGSNDEDAALLKHPMHDALLDG